MKGTFQRQRTGKCSAAMDRDRFPAAAHLKIAVHISDEVSSEYQNCNEIKVNKWK